MANLLVLVSYKVFPPHMGGQKAVVRLYEHLVKYHQVHLVVSTDNVLTEANSLHTKLLLLPHAKMLLNFFKLLRLRKEIRKNKINSIIAEHSYTGWIAYLLQKLTGTPFIIRSHNIEASRFKQMGRKGWKLYSRYEKWIHHKAAHNFFISSADLQTAIANYKLPAAKCSILPYGASTMYSNANARSITAQNFGINSKHIFYFNGTLNYKPNANAVKAILRHINPLLIKAGLDFTIIISGKDLHPQFDAEIKGTTTIKYIGFVEEVNLLYQAADLFLNPVVNDSGVKTKLIEALANNCTVVSAKSGANGVPVELCESKLHTVGDEDYEAFVHTIMHLCTQHKTVTPDVFFKAFFWERIAADAAAKIRLVTDGYE